MYRGGLVCGVYHKMANEDVGGRLLTLIALLFLALTANLPHVTALVPITPPCDSFVNDVTGWLTRGKIPYEKATLVAAAGNEVHFSQYDNQHVFVLGDNLEVVVHLLPSPTCLEETLPPALSQQMTDACSAGLLYALRCSSSLDDTPPTVISSISHIHQDVWYAKTHICRGRLLARLGRVQSRIFARKTIAQRIDTPTSLAFLQEHHLLGGDSRTSKYSYGLYSKSPRNKVLVAVATFSARRNVTRGGQPHRSHELLRFCARRDESVMGDTNKLIKAFSRDHTPDDIVMFVDRDWGPGNEWHGIGFETVAVMPPLLAIIQRDDGRRRYLVGLSAEDEAASNMKNAILGLEPDLLQLLDSIGDNNPKRALHCLADNGYFTVHDTGVECLLMVLKSHDDNGDCASSVTPTKSATDLWEESVPTCASQYYSTNAGISSLLRPAKPMDSPSELANVASWRATSGKPKQLIFSQVSSMDPEAFVQVKERPHGWRTVSLTGGQVKNIFHGVYKVHEREQNDSNNNNGHKKETLVDASANIVEYIQAMASVTLAAISATKATTCIADKGMNGDIPPIRFLHHGLGAGTLPRLLEHCLGGSIGSEHVIVEIDEAVVNAVSSCIDLTDGQNIRIHLGDALEYRDDKGPFDSILVDVFGADNRLPPSFYQIEYLKQLRDDVLTQDGFVVHNFHTNENLSHLCDQLTEAAKAYAAVFESCYVIETIDSGPNGGNTILLATKQGIGGALSVEGLKARIRFNLAFDVSSRVKHARLISRPVCP